MRSSKHLTSISTGEKQSEYTRHGCWHAGKGSWDSVQASRGLLCLFTEHEQLMPHITLRITESLFLCIYLLVSVYVHVGESEYGGQRSTLSVTPLKPSSLIFKRGSLADYQAPGVCLSLVPQHWYYNHIFFLNHGPMLIWQALYQLHVSPVPFMLIFHLYSIIYCIASWPSSISSFVRSDWHILKGWPWSIPRGGKLQMKVRSTMGMIYRVRTIITWHRGWSTEAAEEGGVGSTDAPDKC